jgi:hypothetical protein
MANMLCVLFTLNVVAKLTIKKKTIIVLPTMYAYNISNLKSKFPHAEGVVE